MKFATIHKLNDGFDLKTDAGVEQLKNKYTALNNLDDVALNTLFEKFGVDLNKRYGDFKFSDETKVSVRFFPNNIRIKRHELRENFRNIMLDTYVEFQNEKDDIQSSIKNLPTNRDFPLFFADFKISDEEILNGKEFVKNIKAAKTDAEKLNLINERLDKLINRANKLFEPCTDEEFAKRFKEMNKITTVFANDGLVDCLENYAKITFDDAMKDKIIGLREYSNGLVHKMNERAAKISNATYEFMNSEDVFKLSACTNENLTFEDFNMLYDTLTVDPLAEFVAFNKKFLFVHEPLESLKALNHIKDGDVLFGADGPVNTEEANNIIKENKILGVKDSKGNIKAVGFNNDLLVVSKEVHKDFNKKNVCQRMLDTLNKETHWYNPSSKEYKKMRKTLAEMVEGKGNDYEHIASLKENARKYLENYEFKSKKEGLASKRKACVESMLEQLNNCEYEILVGDSIREHALANENTIEKVEKKQVFQDNTEIMNSSREHLTENEKQLFNANSIEEVNQNEAIKEN